MERTANENLYDALVRHQIYLLRYGGYVRNRINTVLGETEEDIGNRIRDRLADNKGLRTPKDWERLQDLQTAIGAIRSDSWDKVVEVLDTELTDLAYDEAVSVQRIILTTAPVVLDTVLPEAKMLRAIATSRPFEGRVLKEWADTMQAEDLRRISNAVQVGMVAGEDAATIARRVVGTRALSGADGITEMTRKQVEAVVQTAIQHITSNSRDMFYEENADLVLKERFVATLDSRTTPGCRANDGKEYPRGKGPRPPLHFRCRSLRIPVIDGMFAGSRPAKPATTKQLLREFADENGLDPVTSRNDLPRGMKGQFDKFSAQRIRDLVGTVPSETTYQTWLKGQSKSFQEDILGVTKAKLFREGGLTLDRFVNRAGDELTLKELAKKEAAAFRAAGLDPDNF